jgi:hypothetical protein
MSHTPRTFTLFGNAALLLCAAFLCGCATGRSEPVSDSVDVVLSTSEDQVRTALIHVLTEDGYPVRRHAEENRIIITGYREETDSPWDRMLTYRFGVDRSRIDATLTPESDTETRVIVHVTYEAKRYIWSSWRHSFPPLQHTAATQIRRVKKILGLL